MKKLIYWAVPVKSLTAMIFAGFIILYMIVGFLYAFITGEPFEYAIPFMFAIQAAALSVIISVLYTLIFSDVIIKKTRYFLRLIIFAVTLLPVFGICLFAFYDASTEWTKLWLIIGGLIIIGMIIISVLFEIYFKLIGKHYTDILQEYKEKIK